MAIKFVNFGNLQRTSGSFLSPASDFTISFYVKTIIAAGGGDGRAVHVLGDDTYVLPYLWTGTNAGLDSFTTESYNNSTYDDSTSDPTTILNTWLHYALVYDAGAKTFTRYMNGCVVDTWSADITGITFSAEYMMFSTRNTGDAGIAYYRSWQAKLTQEELLTELQNISAVRTDDLFCDSPLTALDLTDHSGNDRHWTATDTPTDITPPMCRLGDIARRNSVGNWFAAGTSITITYPAGTTAGDIVVVGIAQTAGTYGTWPAGWTLIERTIKNTLRTEMYWSRYVSGANFAVTTVDKPVANIQVVSGVAPYGNPVSASSSGTSAANNTGPDSLRVPCDRSAIFAVGATLSAQTGTGSFGLNVTAIGPTADPDISSFPLALQTNGTTRSITQTSAMKIVAGDTGVGRYSPNGGSSTADRCYMWASFVPQPMEISKSRYYLTYKQQKDELRGFLGGDWDSGMSPRAWEYDRQTYGMSLNKSVGGGIFTHNQTNNQTDWDLLWFRWATPPLEAQTISGTLDVMMHGFANFHDRNLGTTADADVVYKVHAYITVGQTTEVRHVLLDNYIDNIANKFTNNLTWRPLNAPATLTDADCEDGDSIIVEIGVHLVCPTPSPTLPPADWALMSLSTGVASYPYTSSLPYQDAVTAVSAVSTFTSFIEFSQLINEKRYTDTIPTHYTPETAKVVTTLPYTDSCDTTHIPVAGRRVWYTYTPAEDQVVIVHAFGANYGVSLAGYSGTPGSLVAAPAETGRDHNVTRSMTGGVFELTGGTTYYFRVSSSVGSGESPSSGGYLPFTITPYAPPADGDVIFTNYGYLMRYNSAGEFVDFSSALFSIKTMGLAIDYTEREMVDFEPPNINTEHRLYAGVFVGGPGLDGTVYAEGDDAPDVGGDWIDILPLDRFGSDRINVDISYIFDAIGSSWTIHPEENRNQGMGSLTMNSEGILALGWFGDGFRRADAYLSSFQDRVSKSVDCEINVFDGLNTDIEAGAPFPQPTRWPVTREDGGSQYVEFADDDKTLYYTSAAWYFPYGTSRNVYTLNSETGEVNLFATVPVSTRDGVNYNPGVKGLFPLPFGAGCLVCNGNEVVRLNSDGEAIQTYQPTPIELSQSLADVELTPDGLGFWVIAEPTGTLWKFDIETGEQLVFNDTRMGSGSLTSLVVYRTSSFTLPCPSITKSHTDPFKRGETNATYQITVTNDSSVTWTDETVVTDTLPTGLTLVSMAGDGWTCVDNVCTRTDGLLAGASFPVITVTVNVASDAPDEVSNFVSVATCGTYEDITNIIDQARPAPQRTPVRWALHRFDIRSRGEERIG